MGEPAVDGKGAILRTGARLASLKRVKIEPRQEGGPPKGGDRHRIEDALSTTRAAVEEGLVAGGGVALLQAIPTLDLVELVGDEAVGLGILRRALDAPIRQIADNAGAHGEVIVEHVKTLPPSRVREPGHGHAFREGSEAADGARPNVRRGAGSHAQARTRRRAEAGRGLARRCLHQGRSDVVPTRQVDDNQQS